MHILLTDILSCPRCGPQHGLVLLADRIADRRVTEGRLGCANCRTTYPVRDGIVDFDIAAADAAAVPADAGPSLSADIVAALMGVVQGPAFVLLAGPVRVDANALATMLDEVEVVTLEAEPCAAVPGVNPLLSGHAVIPIMSAKVSGVALTGSAADRLLEEGARTVAAGGRLVLDPAPADAATRLAVVGLRVIMQQDAVAVAVRD